MKQTKNPKTKKVNKTNKILKWREAENQKKKTKNHKPEI